MLPNEPYVLVLFYSRNGGTLAMAQQVALGIERISGMEAKIRTVPSVSVSSEQTEPSIPDQGAVFVTQDELVNCSGLVLGSPTRFGNMAAPLKHFWDQTSAQWVNGDLVDKPAGVFTSSSTLHGGQESTLLSMMIPLLHHGMIISGLPYTEPELHLEQRTGSPYGATFQAIQSNSNGLSDAEAKLCQKLGSRVAKLAVKIAS